MTETSSQEVGAVWEGVSGEKTDSHEAGGSCEERDTAQSEGLREEPQTCRIAGTCGRCTVQEKSRRKR